MCPAKRIHSAQAGNQVQHHGDRSCADDDYDQRLDHAIICLQETNHGWTSTFNSLSAGRGEPAGGSTESAACAARLRMRKFRSIRLCHYRVSAAARGSLLSPNAKRASRLGGMLVSVAVFSFPWSLVPLVPCSLLLFTASSTRRRPNSKAGSKPADIRKGRAHSRSRRSSAVRKANAGRGSARRDTVPAPTAPLLAHSPG